MTFQEVIWQGKTVLVLSMMSNRGKIHYYVKKYIGLKGVVEREAKNGMLLVRFDEFHARAIPAGCVIVDGSAPVAKKSRRYKNGMFMVEW
jgi:hypothetical protein